MDAYVDLHTIGEKYGKSIGVRGNISPALLLNSKPPEIEKDDGMLSREIRQIHLKAMKPSVLEFHQKEGS